MPLVSRRWQSNEPIGISLNGRVWILCLGILPCVAYRYRCGTDKLKPAKESSGASTKTQTGN